MQIAHLADCGSGGGAPVEGVDRGVVEVCLFGVVCPRRFAEHDNLLVVELTENGGVNNHGMLLSLSAKLHRSDRRWRRAVCSAIELSFDNYIIAQELYKVNDFVI